jgi:hypothetical protein
MPRGKKKVLTPEEEKAVKLKNDYSYRMSSAAFVPEPTYYFNIGDKVHIGNLRDVTIVEILHDGKMYRIQYSVIHTNYGKPYQEDGLERYVWWYDLRPLSQTTESLISEDAEVLKLSYSPMQIDALLGRYYHFGTDMNPDYQRDYVWSEEDKVALIDSIFHGIDIGKFAYADNPVSDHYLYEIIDGKQRLRTIIDFYENRFPYKGKYFNDLCYRDQNHFENYAVSVADVRNVDRNTVMKYFVAMNSQGRIMDSAHLDKVRAMIK